MLNSGNTRLKTMMQPDVGLAYLAGMGATMSPVKKVRMKRWCSENLFSTKTDSLTIELNVMIAPRPTVARTDTN